MAGFFQEDEILGKAYDGRLMRRLLSYLRPYKGPVAVAGPLVSCRLISCYGARESWVAKWAMVLA